jgi:hypothetical protein
MSASPAAHDPPPRRADLARTNARDRVPGSPVDRERAPDGPRGDAAEVLAPERPRSPSHVAMRTSSRAGRGKRSAERAPRRARRATRSTRASRCRARRDARARMARSGGRRPRCRGSSAGTRRRGLASRRRDRARRGARRSDARRGRAAERPELVGEAQSGDLPATRALATQLEPRLVPVGDGAVAVLEEAPLGRCSAR